MEWGGSTPHAVNKICCLLAVSGSPKMYLVDWAAANVLLADGNGAFLPLEWVSEDKMLLGDGDEEFFASKLKREPFICGALQ